MEVGKVKVMGQVRDIIKFVLDVVQIIIMVIIHMVRGQNTMIVLIDVVVLLLVVQVMALIHIPEVLLVHQRHIAQLVVVHGDLRLVIPLMDFGMEMELAHNIIRSVVLAVLILIMLITGIVRQQHVQQVNIVINVASIMEVR